MLKKSFIIMCLLGLFLSLCCSKSLHAATITIDTADEKQRLRGNCGNIYGYILDKSKYKSEEIMRLVETSDVHYFRLRAFWKKIEEDYNDNSDPFDINWSGFDFSHAYTQWEIELMSKLLAAGKIPILNMFYFPNWMLKAPEYKRLEKPNYPEAAELIAAYLLHLKQKGVNIKYIGVVNEPDGSHSPLYGGDLAAFILEVKNMLEYHGLNDVQIHAPDTKGPQESLYMAQDILADQEIREFTKSISSHTYEDWSKSYLQGIQDLAEQYNKEIWYTEIGTNALNNTTYDWANKSTEKRIDAYNHGANLTCQWTFAGAQAQFDLKNPSDKYPVWYTNSKHFAQYIDKNNTYRVSATGGNNGMAFTAIKNKNQKKFMITVLKKNVWKETISFVLEEEGITFSNPQAHVTNETNSYQKITPPKLNPSNGFEYSFPEDGVYTFSMDYNHPPNITGAQTLFGDRPGQNTFSFVINDLDRINQDLLVGGVLLARGGKMTMVSFKDSNLPPWFKYEINPNKTQMKVTLENLTLPAENNMDVYAFAMDKDMRRTYQKLEFRSP